MMSIRLGFVLNRMPSRNPRKQHTVVYCLFTAILFKLVYGMYVICRRVLAPVALAAHKSNHNNFPREAER